MKIAYVRVSTQEQNLDRQAAKVLGVTRATVYNIMNRAKKEAENNDDQKV